MNLVKEEELEIVDTLENNSFEKPDDIQTNGGHCQDHDHHDEASHSDKAPVDEPLVYVCQECGKAYGRQDVLKNHVRTKHGNSAGTEDSLILKCTACEKTYGRKDCLRKHFRRKHIDVAKKYVTFDCDQCDKTFSSRDKLTRHKIQHTASDGKPLS